MQPRDFTLTVYRELIASALGSGYRVLTIRRYLAEQPASPPFIILRHDVDRRAENALQMAEIEASLDVCSTYYFRFNRSVFRKEIVRRIGELGHEIGYHYEVMDRARGDVPLAGHLFRTELEQMRSQAQIETACMHGNPFSRFDNRGLWEAFDPQQFGLIGEAFDSITDPEIGYATDTGRGWNRARFNRKDRFAEGTIGLLPPRDSTAGLIDLLRSGVHRKIYLQVHPSRWSAEGVRWYGQYLEDICVNAAKALVSFLEAKRLERSP